MPIDAAPVSNEVPAASLDSDSRQPVARFAVWLGLSVAFLAFVALAKVSTHLGVEAAPWDKHGREYVWRVWWRSRHQIVDLGPTYGSAVALGVLALGFLLLSVAAIWVVLVADQRPSDNAQASPSEPSFPR